MKKVLGTALLALALGSAGAWAKPAIELARDNQKISQQILLGYVNGRDDHSMLKRLIQTQQALKSSVDTPELQNLLEYIDLCIVDLKRSIQEPFSTSNAEHLNDLIHSINEANHYIIRTISTQNLIASR